jgi:hypothetical protein
MIFMVLNAAPTPVRGESNLNPDEITPPGREGG